MALESKPLFHPEVIRQQMLAFSLPERVADWQPKLQHWADLIASGRADDFKETARLPDFFSGCRILQAHSMWCTFVTARLFDPPRMPIPPPAT